MKRIYQTFDRQDLKIIKFLLSDIELYNFYNIICIDYSKYIHINIKNIIYKILDDKNKIRSLYNILNKLCTFN